MPIFFDTDTYLHCPLSGCGSCYRNPSGFRLHVLNKHKVPLDILDVIACHLIFQRTNLGKKVTVERVPRWPVHSRRVRPETDLKVVAVLSKSQAAKALDITVASLDKWRLKGYGPRFLQIGNRIKYAPDEIEKFLTSCVRIPKIRTDVDPPQGA